MQLGKRALIAIGVEDLRATAEFFRQMAFVETAASDEPYPWIEFSDGQNLILLNQDGMIYRGLLYFSPTIEPLVDQLEQDGIDLVWKKRKPDGTLQSALFLDPNGADHGGHNSLGVNLVAHDPAGLHAPTGEPLTLLGKFGEFSSVTADFAAASAYWQRLGYDEMYRSDEPYPWGILRDGPILLGYHQAPPGHSLSESPALAYFSGDSAKRIARIKALGYTPAFEMPSADGSIEHAGFVAPGGQMFYVFNGEI